jgi:hypothetical protein
MGTSTDGAVNQVALSHLGQRLDRPISQQYRGLASYATAARIGCNPSSVSGVPDAIVPSGATELMIDLELMWRNSGPVQAPWPT